MTFPPLTQSSSNNQDALVLPERTRLYARTVFMAMADAIIAEIRSPSTGRGDYSTLLTNLQQLCEIDVKQR